MTHERAVSESLLLLLLLQFFLCCVFACFNNGLPVSWNSFPPQPFRKISAEPCGAGSAASGRERRGAASFFLVPQVEQKISARVVRTTAAAAAVSEAPPPPPLSHPSLMVSCHLAFAPRTKVSRKPEQLLGSGRRSQQSR